MEVQHNYFSLLCMDWCKVTVIASKGGRLSSRLHGLFDSANMATKRQQKYHKMGWVIECHVQDFSAGHCHVGYVTTPLSFHHHYVDVFLDCIAAACTSYGGIF